MDNTRHVLVLHFQSWAAEVRAGGDGSHSRESDESGVTVVLDPQEKSEWTLGSDAAGLDMANPDVVVGKSCETWCRHAVIRFQNGAFLLLDLPSWNGTTLARGFQRWTVSETVPVVLETGDVIVFPYEGFRHEVSNLRVEIRPAG